MAQTTPGMIGDSGVIEVIPAGILTHLEYGHLQ
jgi:hypothetical protein